MNTRFAKNYHLHWITDRADILIKSIIYITFRFWTLILWFFFCHFQILAVKKLWTNFCCIVLLFVRAQKACLIFWKCYLKLKKLIFLIYFLHVPLQSSLSFHNQVSWSQTLGPTKRPWSLIPISRCVSCFRYRRLKIV